MVFENTLSLCRDECFLVELLSVVVRFLCLRLALDDLWSLSLSLIWSLAVLSLEAFLTVVLAPVLDLLSLLDSVEKTSSMARFNGFSVVVVVSILSLTPSKILSKKGFDVVVVVVVRSILTRTLLALVVPTVVVVGVVVVVTRLSLIFAATFSSP